MKAFEAHTPNGLVEWFAAQPGGRATKPRHVMHAAYRIMNRIDVEGEGAELVGAVNSRWLWLSLPAVQNYFMSGLPLRLVFVHEDIKNKRTKIVWTPPMQVRDLAESCGTLCYTDARISRVFSFGEAIEEHCPDWMFYESHKLMPRLLLSSGKESFDVSSDAAMKKSLVQSMKLLRMEESGCMFRIDFAQLNDYLRKMEADDFGGESSLADSEASCGLPTPPLSRPATPPVALPTVPQMPGAGGDEARVRDALTVGAGDGRITSMDCLRKMYGKVRPYRGEAALGTMPLRYHRATYKRGVDGNFVKNEDGRRVAEEKAYDKAKQFVIDHNCAMFAFDNGADTRGMDEKEAKRAAFSKQYMTGTYLGLASVFERGNPSLWRWDRDRGEPVDLGLHRNCYESLFFWRATKFFADLEFSLEYNPTRTPEKVDAMMTALVQFVIEMARTLCRVDLVRGDFLVVSSDSDKKISRHLICLNPKFMFRSLMALNWFYVMCEEELRARANDNDLGARSLFMMDKNGVPISFWDFCTTKEFQLFRVLFADKFQANRPLIYQRKLNDLSDPESYVSQFDAMNPCDQFLNALIQTPWRMRYPPEGEEGYVDFEVAQNVRIGRFQCVVNDGELTGFQSSAKRRGASGKVLRVRRSVSSNAGDLSPEQHSALKAWLEQHPMMEVWRGHALSTAVFKFTERKQGGRFEGKAVMVEMKGDIHCFRREMRLTDPEYREALRKHGNENPKPTHTGCPVLLIIQLKPHGCCPVIQTCNRTDECGKVRAYQLGDTPRELGLLLLN